jgi:hypothetical protein
MDCIPLPHQDVQVLKYMDKQPDDNLQPQFVSSLRRVVEHSVKATSFLKSIACNSAMDGVAFAALTCKLVQLVNTPGTIPPFRSIWDDVLTNIISTSMDEAVNHYKTNMEKGSSKLPVEVDVL